MKAIVFLADGFEECEGLIVVDILRRAGIETIMVSVMGRLEVESSRHIVVRADVLAEEIDYSSVDLIFLPGGRIGVENLRENELVLQKCREFVQDRIVAAVCGAPSILAEEGLLEGRKATCHPDFLSKMTGSIITRDSVVVDGNIITGEGLGTTFSLAFELVRLLVGFEKEESIKQAICYK